MKTLRLMPDQIDVGGGRRAVDPEKVQSLAESMEKVGLINPITVRVVEDEFTNADGEVVEGTNVLIAGAHRLAAARQLGWGLIDCIELECDEIDAELCEIAENLHRAELTQLQRSDQIDRWVDLVDAKRVSAQCAPKPQGGRPESGINAASRELGIERTDAQRAVKVASITEAAKEAARKTGLDDNRSALLKAAQAPADKQEAVIHLIAQAKALRSVMSEDEKRERWLNNLLRAWESADLHTRETFLQMVDAPVMDRGQS